MLTPGEVDDLFEVIRSLVAAGKSIIFITHKLREVLAVADRITVLRGGRGRRRGRSGDGDGRQPRHAHGRTGRQLRRRQGAEPARAPGRCGSRGPRRAPTTAAPPPSTGFDLEVRAGEIFGIAGVEGNGQRELVEALMGMRPKLGGTVEIDGARRHLGQPPPR